jgi:hypothetical protein
MTRAVETIIQAVSPVSMAPSPANTGETKKSNREQQNRLILSFIYCDLLAKFYTVNLKRSVSI